MQLGNLAGNVLDDKYLIERELGRGGMGAVYKAIHVGTDRPVAVKVIVPQFMASDEFIERFRREAKAAGRLRHPNVVDVTDFGFALVGSHRIAYLVMEYLDGCTLSDILAEESMLPIPWVADILDQVCSAVDEAHKIGIVHRDLKPDNIWLEPNRRDSYTVKVLDFGLAKIERTLASTEQQSPGV
ncbi:MAG TPA: serine/threonine-protein kinase, partial [Blastocatellia bacterium]|nr:serine/threonine-protein kinase [Blastocatellia bacterium]